MPTNQFKALLTALLFVAGGAGIARSGIFKYEYENEDKALAACRERSAYEVRLMSSGQGDMGALLAPKRTDDEFLMVDRIYCKKSNTFVPWVGIYTGYVDYLEKEFDEEKITNKSMTLPPYGVTYKK